MTQGKKKRKTKKTHLLDHSTGIHLHGEVNDFALHLRRQHLLLHLVSVLEELLNDVVSKHIFH